jgi:C4-dicarboxylate-specific signal transduction histidine kinase
MKHIHRLSYPPGWSIAIKVSAALLAAALIPMSFNAYYNLQRDLKRTEEGEYRQLELLATSAASRLDQLIIDVQHIVVQISTDKNAIAFLNADTSSEKKAVKSDLQDALENVFRSNSIYDAVYLIDANGNCVASTDSAFISKNYSFREYFRHAKQGKAYISSILMGKTTGRPGLYLSHPVRAANGRVIGVAVIKIKEEDIAKIVNGLDLDPKSYAFLIDQIGVIISHPDKSLLYHSLATLSWKNQQQIKIDQRYHLKQIASLNLNKLANEIVGATKPGHISYESPLKEQRQRVGFAPLQVEPWVLGVNRPEKVFAAPLRHLIWQNSISLLIVGAIASLLAIILARSIAKPIRELTITAKAIESDRFEYEGLLQFADNRDDIGQLVRVFIHMAEQVKAREQKLKQQVVELNFEIDEAKRERQVAAVTGTQYFQQLQQKAHRLKQRSPKNNETEYFQQLQQKAQDIKSQKSKVKSQESGV